MLVSTLEARRLLSVSLDPTTHVLTVTGTTNDDVITVALQSGQLKVTDNGTARLFPLAAVRRVAVNARAGGDTVTVDQAVLLPTTLDSGPGGGYGDDIQGGGGPDTIFLRGIYSAARGGGGGDTIYNYGAGNAVYGEAGGDFLASRSSQENDCRYDGGPGVDTIDYSAATVGLVIRNGQVAAARPGTGLPPQYEPWYPDTVGGFENFFGGQGDDYIYGTAGVNILKGNGGNDYLRGGAGNDVLYGGAGRDALYGDDGDDTLYANDGAQDFLSGGLGTDRGSRDASDVVNGVEVVVK
ncbi:MAG TPA: hypothetical protein VF796_26405 [Humisphaera sp.]